ncbi:restriction endonuclease subunit S [Runella slithyformis]|uniref:Restriction modification system DNA specificity domain protein n=1 Tax=Runella slithyformis (strain ATCC 29530 / DSM 19594 / LMG 11500 / NCIMB 11436 / LSU 4) TaxID=761193 RepID=A0A7U3ZRL8_RUNSL|nr:restriction endonuclease subunit S [Runella slithyformis]AEI52058.1 restriction modification system DNA specificity domain protein [Runella slithyformis DSM 19594]
MELAELTTIPTTENQLPEGWMNFRLGVVCKIKKGVQFNKIELSDAGVFPCINGGIEPSGYSDLWNTHENTITISEGGNSCGYVNFIKTKFWSGGHCYTLLDLKENLDKKFLYQVLKGRQNLIMDLRVGSGLPNIQQKAIKEFEIPLPQSLIEQRQIAAILTKIDEAITQTEALIAKYNRLKTGLMQDLLSRGIDEQGRIRNEATHAFKDSPLGRIPVEWGVEKLSKLAKITAGVTLGKEYAESGSIELPYLRVANVQDGYLDLSDIKYVRVPIAQLSRYKLEIGDVLMNEGGDFDKLGRGSVWQGQIPNCLHQNHVFKVRLNQKAMLPEFLSLFSSSSFGKSFFILSSKQSTNLASINKNQLSEFPILKPCIEEQISILETIHRQSNLILEMEKHLQKLKSLKSGLMQDLLSGRVRVGQTAEK